MTKKNGKRKIKVTKVSLLMGICSLAATTMNLLPAFQNRRLQHLREMKEAEEFREKFVDSKKYVDSHKDVDSIQLASFDDDTLALTILPHELPGYTGWARPSQTLVDFFHVVGFSAPHATVGKDWSVEVECRHRACLKGGSLFFIRAYGRSLLPGRFVDHENGKYTVTILPHDAGRYTLEVVLTCSQRPNWRQLPSTGQELSYEGFLVPGFPLHFTVKPGPSKALGQTEHSLESKLPVCTAKQMIETSTDSAVASGRWLVVNKTRSLSYTPREETTSWKDDREQINIGTYIQGFASVGFQMQYFPLECSLLSVQQLNNNHTWLHAIDKQPHFRGKIIHVVFVGDSNTRNQFNYMRDNIVPLNKIGLNLVTKLDGRLRLSYVDMMGAWQDTLPKTKERLDEIKIKYKDDLFFVIFNAGLHEVQNRCTQAALQHNLTHKGGCQELYQNDVKELVRVMQNFPAQLKVWQTTTAGWPKWGVYGIAWPQAQGQRIPKEPNFCEYLNQLAWGIINKAKIPVLDTYWLTVSRADHREVVESEIRRLQYKLVHFGPEVYSLLVRKFCMMILEALAKGKEGQVYL